MVQDILCKHLADFSAVFVDDDINLFSRLIIEQVKHLRFIFKRLTVQEIDAKGAKSSDSRLGAGASFLVGFYEWRYPYEGRVEGNAQIGKPRWRQRYLVIVGVCKLLLLVLFRDMRISHPH